LDLELATKQLFDYYNLDIRYCFRKWSIHSVSCRIRIGVNITRVTDETGHTIGNAYHCNEFSSCRVKKAAIQLQVNTQCQTFESSTEFEETLRSLQSASCPVQAACLFQQDRICYGGLVYKFQCACIEGSSRLRCNLVVMQCKRHLKSRRPVCTPPCDICPCNPPRPNTAGMPLVTFV